MRTLVCRAFQIASVLHLWLAESGWKGGAMFTISQIEGLPLKRVLECVWSLSDEKLTCVWVKPSFEAAAGECARDEEQDLSQRVA